MAARAGHVTGEEVQRLSRLDLEIHPLFAQGRIELLDHPQLARELRILGSRPRAGGRPAIDHPQGAHDDHANAFALAAVELVGRYLELGDPSLGAVRRPPTSLERLAGARDLRLPDEWPP